MAADGILSQYIAQQLRISRPPVQLWRQQFLSLRCAGLKQDAPRPGRIPRISERAVRAVIKATFRSTHPAATHWSTRSMAEAHGLSEATIRRGSFTSVPELIAAIRDYLAHHNQNPRVFTWTASVERILSKVTKCKERWTHYTS